MTNRGQIIRSSTKGAVPAAATRAAGELWTNFPDKQLGVIDTARTAQPLVAVRYFSTGADYVAGDCVMQAGVPWIAKASITAGAFNATQWLQVATTADIGTLGGAIGDNRLINGDMRIDQRNNGAGGTATGYTIDRWAFNTSMVGKLTWSRNSATGQQFPCALATTTTSAVTPTAPDTCQFSQAIEADMISDLLWGTGNARPVTLSFWTFSSVAGTFSGSVCNAAGTRSYPFTYTVPASAWAQSVVVIPGDTIGTWTLSGNGVGMYVRFDYGCGANSRASANVWAAANYVGVTGAVSLVANASAYFNLTGVKLEIGSVATPFNHQSLAKSVADCQRYYQTLAISVQSQAVTVGGQISMVCTALPVTMRATPTAAITSTVFAGAINGMAAGFLGAGSMRIEYGYSALNTLGNGSGFVQLTAEL